MFDPEIVEAVTRVIAAGEMPTNDDRRTAIRALDSAVQLALAPSPWDRGGGYGY
jgi:hypothetical protein